MGTITKRVGALGVKYRVQICDPAQGRRLSQTFSRKADAEAWERRAERDLRRARAGLRQTPVRLSEAVEMYRAQVLSSRAPSTRRSKERHLAYWSEVIGHFRLDQITPAVIAECREDLRNGRGDARPGDRAPSTVNRYLETLAHLLSVAVREWQMLESSPATAVQHLPEPQGRLRFLSDDDRRRLLSAASREEGEDLHLAVLLSLTTGMRRSELLGLRGRQIDLDRRRILLDHTKSGRRRSVPLPALAIDALRKRNLGDDELLFPSPVDPSKPSTMRRPFERAVAAAGLEDFVWHDLRHTAASYLAMSGASLRDLAEILGHSSLAMVQRYAHLTHGHLVEVMDRMTEHRGLTSDPGAESVAEATSMPASPPR